MASRSAALAFVAGLWALVALLVLHRGPVAVQAMAQVITAKTQDVPEVIEREEEDDEAVDDEKVIVQGLPVAAPSTEFEQLQIRVGELEERVEEMQKYIQRLIKGMAQR